MMLKPFETKCLEKLTIQIKFHWTTQPGLIRLCHVSRMALQCTPFRSWSHLETFSALSVLCLLSFLPSGLWLACKRCKALHRDQPLRMQASSSYLQQSSTNWSTFLMVDSSVLSSQGTVSSTITNCLVVSDHKIMGGLSVSVWLLWLPSGWELKLVVSQVGLQLPVAGCC